MVYFYTSSKSVRMIVLERIKNYDNFVKDSMFFLTISQSILTNIYDTSV